MTNVLYLLFLLATVFDQTILGTVSCTEKINSIATLALRNGAFHRLGNW